MNQTTSQGQLPQNENGSVAVTFQDQEVTSENNTSSEDISTISTEEEVASEATTNETTEKRNDAEGDEPGAGTERSRTPPSSNNSTEEQTREKTEVVDEDDTSLYWCSCWDEMSGAWYFHNTTTGETTWQNPYETTVEPSSSGAIIPEEENLYQQNEVVDASYSYQADPFEQLLDRADRIKDVLDGCSQGKKEEVVTLPLPPPPAASPISPWTDSYGGWTPEVVNPYPPALPITSVDDYLVGEDYTVRAHFNSRTGKFQPVERVIEDPRDRFSQTAKAERQCGVYFDYGSWAQMKGEKGGANGGGGGGKVTVRSRKEIQMLRQKKKEKKEQKRKALFAD